MNRKYDISFVKNNVHNLGYVLLDNSYQHTNQKLTMIDDIGYIYYTSFNSLLQKIKPSRFHKYNPYTIDNIKLWCELNNKNFRLLSNTYNKNSEMVKWECLKENCGEIFEAPWQWIHSGQGCGYCHGLKVGLSNCLATKNPELSKEWHPIKNGDLTPFNVTAGANKKAWWKCKNNSNHEWESYIKSRSEGVGCPYCPHSSYIRATEEYNLLICNKLLASEWDYEKNDKNPEDYTPNSSAMVWWKCNKNENHNWKNLIYLRNKNSDCPYCNNRKAHVEYNLMKDNPDLCIEWDYSKNIKHPTEYTPKSGEKVWWICKKNNKHRWKATIDKRNKSKQSCPYCSGRYATEENNLLKHNPELCNEWDYNKNKNNPEDYTPMSGYLVWWKCSKCGNEWKSTIDTRNGNKKAGCPNCTLSKGENKILNFLKKNGYHYKPQHSIDGCRNIRDLLFDFGVFLNSDFTDLICVIEYDGEFHYKPARYSKDKNKMEIKLKETQKRDLIKNEYCRKNNIKLLRIPYWDFDNVEDILVNYFKSLIV